MTEPKIKFVSNMNEGAGFIAICLFWIHEIHVDESFKDSKALPDIIKHEKHHYYLLTKILETKSRLKRMLLGLYNNTWDFLDVRRIIFKHPTEFKSQVIFQSIICIAFCFFLFLVF